jgi:hypothetical protein
VVDADNYLSDSETILLSRAMQIWDLELTKETKQARNPNDMLTQQSSARPPSIIEMHF